MAQISVRSPYFRSLGSLSSYCWNRNSTQICAVMILWLINDECCNVGLCETCILPTHLHTYLRIAMQRFLCLCCSVCNARERGKFLRQLVSSYITENYQNRQNNEISLRKTTIPPHVSHVSHLHKLRSCKSLNNQPLIHVLRVICCAAL